MSNENEETGPIKFPPWVHLVFFSLVGVFAMILKSYPSLQEATVSKYSVFLKPIAYIGPGWFAIAIVFAIINSLADLGDAQKSKAQVLESSANKD